jgi:ribonuclease Z
MYGPIGLAMLLKTNFELSDSHLAFKLRVFEFVPPEIKQEDLKTEVIKTELMTSSFIFYDSKKSCYTLENVGVSGVIIFAAPILHRVFTVGYVIQEESKVGKLDVEKLKKTGIKPGPMFSKIKNKEDVKMEDGTMIYWKDYIGEDIIGRKIVILGDTYDPRGIAKIAHGCDVITHESTLDDDDSVSCIEKGHSTPKMAASFAESIKAKKLILTHYSARFAPLIKEKDDDRVSISLLRDQAKKIFENVEMAEDFKTFEFKREK